MELHVYHHIVNDAAPTLARILSKMGLIQGKQETIVATLDQILQNETAMGPKLDAIAAGVATLKQELADILGGTLPPALQAKVDSAFAAAEANMAKADAIGAASALPAA